MLITVVVVVVVVVAAAAAVVVVVVIVETLQSILLYTQLERQQSETLNQRGNGIQCTAIC